MDPMRCLVRLHDKKTGRLVDKTADVSDYKWVGGRLRVTFTNGRSYEYNSVRVDVREGTPEPVLNGNRVAVRESVWDTAVSITRFGDLTRVTARLSDGTLKHYLHDTTVVDVIGDAATRGASRQIVDYWHTLAASLTADDPTRRAFGRLAFINPESALATYLEGGPIEAFPEPVRAIYPFNSNISQRAAVDQALRHPLSVIEGPPGTGKTQTILNIVASLVAAGNQSVAVVSSTNSAVDNVREKLDGLGVGFVAAALGNRDNQAMFLQDQERRNAAVDAAMAQLAPPRTLTDAQLERLTRRLREAQEFDRERARLQTEIAAYRLEHRHFVAHLDGQELPDLAGLPLFQKEPDRILDYLAETSVEAAKPGFVTRVRRYFRYGRTGDVDPNDIAAVLRLQERYYERRLAELEASLVDVTRRLERADLERLAQEHSAASRATLDQALRDRYAGRVRRVYVERPWQDSRFLDDYPVILSTCHSLATNLPRGGLVDTLIIDEASQVSLLVAAVALACAKRVIVVGDTRQLPHIPGAVPDGLETPHPAYDHRRQNLLSSLHVLYGQALPSTMLVEHYRCAPEIIGFCNRSFYDGRLINFSQRESAGAPMHVWVTSEGNHMKSLTHGGGTSNQREIDVIREEVIPQLGLVGRQVGYIAPYRLQADKLGAVIETSAAGDDLVDVSVPPQGAGPKSQADTVHRFQGRECDVVVMSSVIDNSWRGERALKFVDDARLINVAVSRAVNEFVLVAHHDRHPRSRYLSDLIGYIEYHDPDAVRESEVISIFDLLYKDYSARLRPFAARINGASKYLSENAAGTLIEEILTADEEQERYGGLSVVPQYRLSNLFTDTTAFTREQRRFIGTTASVDFLVYRTVSLRPVLAIEVDGWSTHANNPEQLVRDRTKDAIFEAAHLPLLRLPTNGSGEKAQITQALDAALRQGESLAANSVQQRYPGRGQTGRTRTHRSHTARSRKA